MTGKRRVPQWLPWTVALLVLTLLALLDRRDAQPQRSEASAAQLSHD